MEEELYKLRVALRFVWNRIETNEVGALRMERGWRATFDYEELEAIKVLV